MYIIDTNILIDALAGEHDLKKSLKSLGRSVVTVFTYAEFLYGFYGQKAYESMKHTLGSDFEILPATKESAEVFVEIKGHQKKSGQIIPDIDLHIASIAISNNLILVTRDKHFERIQGLKTISI